MVPQRPSTVGLVLVVVGALLLANPLYLHAPNPDDTMLTVRETSLADGVAAQSPDVRAADRLPAVARYAVSTRLATGSFAIDADGPPVSFEPLAPDGRYLVSPDPAGIYDPTVTVHGNRTTLTLAPVDVTAVEADLGVTPPARLDPASEKAIVWLADSSDAVYSTGEFTGSTELALERAVANGSVSLSNGNDASSLSPLGEEVTHVVANGTAYRATVSASDGRVVLSLEPVADDALLSTTDVAVVNASSLSPGSRGVFRRAIQAEGGSVRFRRSAANVTELAGLDDAVVRGDGHYYVVTASALETFSVVPLIGDGLTAVGAVLALAGVGLLGWRWRRPRDA